MPADAAGGPFLAEMAAEVRLQQSQQKHQAPGAKAGQLDAGSDPQQGRASTQKQRKMQATDVEQGVMEAVAGARARGPCRGLRVVRVVWLPLLLLCLGNEVWTSGQRELGACRSPTLRTCSCGCKS